MSEPLSLLVVDDELHARASIRLKINPDRFPASQIEEACDGFDAIEKIGRRRFDVVLTDIRMAGMDGLELIGHIKARQPDTRFLIVSGFNDFDYARTGFRLGVKDYLLKPVREEQLNDQLDSICTEILEAQKEKEVQATLTRTYTVHRYQETQLALNRLLLGDFAPDELECLQTALFSSGSQHATSCYTVLSLQFRHPLYDGAHPDPTHHQRMEALFAAFHCDLAPTLAFNIKNPRELWAVVQVRERDESRWNSLGYLYQALLSACDARGMEVAIGVGVSVTAPAELHTATKEAQVACRNKLLGGYGRVYRFEDMQIAAPPARACDSPESLHLISRSLQDKDIPEAKARLGRWLDHLAQAENVYPRFIHRVMDLYRLLLQDDHNRVDPELDRVFFQQLYHLDDVSDIKALFCDYIDNLFHRDDRAGILNGKEIVRLSIEYIQAHYREQITLESLTRKFHIHPNYLCRAFKKHSHYNFNEYLTKVRMDQAYQMLTVGKAKVLEVSEILGYNDSKYFSKVFKKHFGISPSQLTLTQGMQCVDL